MSFIYNPSAGNGGGSVNVIGNGAVYHKDGVLYAHSHYAVDPVIITDSDGVAGPPRWTVRPGRQQLALVTGLSGTITTDQIIPIKGAAQYVIDSIYFINSTGVAAEMTGGIYSNADKPATTGASILPATQTYVGLNTDPYNVIKLQPSVAYRAAPYIYFSLTTPNATPITFDVVVFGDVIKPLEV